MRPPPVTDRAPERLVARNFLALGGGEAAARVIAFIATVWVARRLGAASYGVLELAAAVTLYFARVADAGFDLGLGVREIAARPREASAIASSALGARVLLSFLCIAGLVALGLTALPQPEGHAIALYSLTLLAVGLGTRWVHLGFERSRLVAAARTAGEAAMAVAVVLFVRAPADLLRVPLAKLGGDLLAAGALLVGLARRGVSIRPRLDAEILRPLGRRAVPLVASAFFGLMIYNADLIFLRIFRERTDVGHYAAAYALISFLVNLGIAYSMSLLPTLTRLADETAERRRLYHAAHVHVVALGLPVAVGGALLARPIVGLVFGSGYDAAAPALAILIWSIPIGLLRDLPVVALMAGGREGTILRLTAVAAVLNLGLNLALVPPYGIAGAAVATLITEAARMGIFVASARRLDFRAPSPRRYARPAAAAVVMAGVLLLLGPRHALLSVAVGGGAYLAALWALGGVAWTPGRPPRLGP